MESYIEFIGTLQNSGFWLVKVWRTRSFHVSLSEHAHILVFDHAHTLVLDHPPCVPVRLFSCIFLANKRLVRVSHMQLQ